MDDDATPQGWTATVTALTASVDQALAGPVIGMAGPVARELIEAVEVQARRLHAAHLRLVGASVAADQVDAGVGAGRQSTAGFMSTVLKMRSARANADVNAAKLLDPDTGTLRALGAALAQGRTSADHVRVACRAMDQLPSRLVTGDRARLDAAVTEHATTFGPEDSTTLAKHLLSVLCPDKDDAYDERACERRSFHTSTDWTGMVVSRGQHDPASGAFLVSAVEALADLDRPVPHCGDNDNDEPLVGLGDGRTLAMRRHDALHDIIRAGVEALASDDTTGRIGAAMARVQVVTTVDQLATVPQAEQAAHAEDTGDAAEDATGGPGLDTATPGSATWAGHGPVSAGFLQQVACDAVLDRVVLDHHGALVAMTSTARLATPGMVRALIARDGGCTFPGCTRPPRICDAHHVTWWSRGGPTQVDNLTLLCGPHHRTIHTGTWDLRMRHGRPEYRPPWQSGPDQPWLRDTMLDAVHRTRRLAQALARACPEPAARPEPPARPAGWESDG